MHLLAALFTEPIQVNGIRHLLMLLPLSLTVAVVYKALKLPNVKQLPVAAAALWVTMVLGMLGVGIALLIAYELLK